MVQIGDFHLGRTETAAEPELSITEASLLWDLTTSRYKCIEETQLYLNYAHDVDLKQLIRTGMDNILERQANELEKQLNRFRIPLPERPPKSVRTKDDDAQVFNDQFLLRQIFEGCQQHIDYLARISRSMITSDALRHMAIGFLQDELSAFDNLCRYAKLKGWLAVPPIYKAD